MSTLILHTPTNGVGLGKQSFDATIKSKIATGFAISKKNLTIAQQCSDVIILDKNRKKKASGTIVQILLSKKSPAGNGMSRYDISFKEPKAEKFHAEPLSRSGIGIKDGKKTIVP